jgi:ABC-type transporter Mla maintaining outer membrane lipid asymmetry ATPase subunit MlaF
MATTSPEPVVAGPDASDETVIDVRGLRMRYGAFEAVRGIDLHVRRAEVFAFLGPKRSNPVVRARSAWQQQGPGSGGVPGSARRR